MIQRCAIIGAGISGLSAAYFLNIQKPDVSITVYDAQERAGGVIRSERISGCVVEGGPDSFLTMKKSAVRLCEAIGLQDKLVGSNDSSRKTFIFDESELKELPEGFFMMVPTRLLPLIKSNLLSWPGKLEALNDLFSHPDAKELTVSDFLQNRFGSEITQKIGEPLIRGIYGADIKCLSLKSALPQLWEMQKKGSLMLQLIRRKANPMSESLFTTLEDGMESLITGLVEKISAEWKMAQPVESVARKGKQWMISGELYDVVVVSGSRLPVLDIPEFLELESLWNSVQRNSAIVVALAFSGVSRTGFGWLVGAAERRSILACTYVSNKFPRRSPENLLLVRVFMVGGHAEKWIDRSDAEIQIEVLSELKRIAGIDETPEFCRIFRWPNAMPEYHVGHETKMQRIDKLIRLNGGLYATGNAFCGVGLPDCIQHAEKVVAELCQ